MEAEGGRLAAAAAVAVAAVGDEDGLGHVGGGVVQLGRGQESGEMKEV